MMDSEPADPDMSVTLAKAHAATPPYEVLTAADQIRTHRLDAVWARLHRIMDTGDTTLALAAEAVAEARRLAELLQPFDGDIECRHALGWLHWIRHEQITDENGSAERAIAVEMFLPCFIFGEGNLPDALVVELAEETAPAASRLLAQADATRDVDTVLRAAIVWSRVVDALPAGHPVRGEALSSLGHALLLRFGHTKASEDLEGSISASREALRCVLADPANRGGVLHHLGLALQVRFERIGDQASLLEAIAAHRNAVAITPSEHPHHVSLMSGLSIALMLGSSRTNEPEHLGAAIETLRAVVSATADDDPHRAARLSNLGVMLHQRYDITKDLRDLDSAINACRAAVELTPSTHAKLAAYLSTTADVLHARFEHTGDLADIDAAVAAARRAVDITPAEHLDPVAALTSLGSALKCRSDRTGDVADRQEAVRAYLSVVDVVSAPPSIRIRAARNAANLLVHSDPPRAADLLETAVQMLPRVAPRQLQRSDHRHVLDGFTNLAGDAAALALADHEMPEEQRIIRALRQLETGRAVLISQILETRGEVNDLRHQHPALAERFIALRDRLDQPVDSFTVGTDRHQLTHDIEALIAKIRAQEGFAAFGLPPTLSDLLPDARHGSVVVFNTSVYRCDALILTESGIVNVTLPGLTLHTLIENLRSFYAAINTPAESADQLRVLEWLWDNIMEPVLTDLGYDRTCPEEAAPRVWWAPGGILGLLPLHAAGYHTDHPEDPRRRTVLDRVVSSYTASVRALHHVRQRIPTPQFPTRALIVAMPNAPRSSESGELPHVRVEAMALQRRLPNSVLLLGNSQHSDTPDSPTRANVLRHLPTCAVAHFACHGIPNPTDPSQSLLLLQDPLTVADLGELKLDQAQIAFLSACTTATVQNTALIDEAVHLATAFQLAGFPHVTATLWEVRDRVAARIADAFYAELHVDQQDFTPGESARALHHAVRTVRDKYPAHPSLWAAHVHFGS